ncbi:MAG: hypothetical protein U0R52_01975 [Solirubrobacterales bacterium]
MDLELSGIQALMVAGALIGGGVAFGRSLGADWRGGVSETVVQTLYGIFGGGLLGFALGWAAKALTSLFS